MNAVVFSPIGPNPAPLSELLWALHRQRGLVIDEVHVVVDDRARFYLDDELMKPGAALDQLRSVLGEAVPPRERFHVYPAVLPDGRLLRDDLDPAHARIYLRTLWKAAKAAVAAAGKRPLIFGLIGGRRRTVTALQTSMFQLLAREGDSLVDVRVSDPRVEGAATSFYFPEQPEQDVPLSKITVKASSVSVHLVDVVVPRLRGMLPQGSLRTYEGALGAGQAAIDAASLPVLEIDLEAGEARADGELIPLSSAELVWYAFLAAQRGDRGAGWVRAGQDGHDELRAFVARLREREWFTTLRTKPLVALASGEWVDDEDLRNLRGKTVQKLKTWCTAHRPGAAHLLVPEVDLPHHRQRLPLPADRIVLREPPITVRGS